MKPKRPTKSKALRPAKPGSGSLSGAVAGGREATFREVVGLIQDARGRALQAVNTELVELYWRVGEFISGKIETAAWGEGVVEELARFIARRHPDIKGFTRRSLFRMRQFFDTYRAEEREFYLRLAAREKWTKRELERQLNGALFVRAALAKSTKTSSGECASQLPAKRWAVKNGNHFAIFHRTSFCRLLRSQADQ